MKKNLLTAFLCLNFAACTTLGTSQIAVLDPSSGLLKTNGALREATVTLTTNFNHKAYQNLAVIDGPAFTPMNAAALPDNVQQLKELHFFKEVIGPNQLDKLVADQNLQSEITQAKTRDGMKKLFQRYGPYMYIHFRCFYRDGAVYQIVATNPESWDDMFVSEIVVRSATEYIAASLLTLGSGMTNKNLCTSVDADGRYPLFNALNRWLGDAASK